MSEQKRTHGEEFEKLDSILLELEHKNRELEKIVVKLVKTVKPRTTKSRIYKMI